jgi:hypothetical protein
MDLYVSWQGDALDKKVSELRLKDDAGGIAQISQAVEAGTAIFTSFAGFNGGSVIDKGYIEGLLTIPVSALKNLEQARLNYESCVKATVSVGVGKTPSQSSKALLVAKLRGRNKTVVYDNNVEKEVQEAANEKSEHAKIIEEYLTKGEDEGRTEPEGRHRDGFSPHQNVERKIPQFSMPRMKLPSQADAPNTAAPFNLKDIENQFRQHADQNEARDKAKNARSSESFRALKDQIAGSLQAFNAQAPLLANFQASNPEGYQALLGIIQGLIGLGRQINEADQALAKAEKLPKRYWVGDSIKIPSQGTAARRQWNDSYKQLAANQYTDGKTHLLKHIQVAPKDVVSTQTPTDNVLRKALYARMLKGADKLPPVIVYKEGDTYKLLDGLEKYTVALEANLETLDAYEVLGKNMGAMAFVNQVPPDEAGMGSAVTIAKQDLLPGGIADRLRPEDFDQEALAIGTQIEFEHTKDLEIAREIAMDHLAEDPDYYQKLSEMEAAE